MSRQSLASSRDRDFPVSQHYQRRNEDRPSSSSPLSESMTASSPTSSPPKTNGSNTSRSRAGAPIYSPIPVHLALTTQSLSHLSLAGGEGGDDRPTSSSAASSSGIRLSSPAEARLKAGSRRAHSTAPSSTSVSDNEEDEDGTASGKRNDADTEPSSPITVDVQQAKSWLDMSEDRRDKGKGKMAEPEGMAARLPPEILMHIFRLLPDTRDLLSALLVNRTWCLYTFSLLWYKPHLPDVKTLASLIRVIANPNSSLPYAQAVRRLHLSQLHPTITDDLILGLSACTRVERLTLTGAAHLSPEAIAAALREMPLLQAADFSGVMAVDDSVVEVLAKTCVKLQAINLSECKLVGDKGVLALAEHSKLLRRAKFQQCHRITDRSLIPFIQSCKLLLELDLQDVLTLTNAAVHSIFLHLTYLRDLRLNGCVQLTEDCIPHLPGLSSLPDDQVVQHAKSVGLDSDDLNHLRPVNDIADNLRSVDLTGCTNLGDKAIEHLIVNAPKLRSLTLTKCSLLTDQSLESIERLGKHLHYLHVGHVRLITDQGVTSLAKCCTRLRYVDLACCELLTDESISEIGANMPKLRRVGLVKVVNLTDDAIYSLVERYSALERVHLSYCDNLTVKAITFMLNRLVHLKHLSLTGVSAFKKPELQRFCRAPPSNFNEHQRAAFCVFSGHKVDELRRFLNESYLCSGLESDDTSTRRGSSSSTSSITLPGGGSPPLSAPGQNQAASGYVFRRGSAPILRDREYNNGLGLAAPGLPSGMFTSPAPNFLSPTMEFPSRSASRTVPRNPSVDAGLSSAGANTGSGTSRGNGNASGAGAGVGLGIGVPSRLRESQSTATTSDMSSRSGSASSQDDRWRRFTSLQRDREWDSERGGTGEERDRPLGPRAPSGPGTSVSGSGRRRHLNSPHRSPIGAEAGPRNISIDASGNSENTSPRNSTGHSTSTSSSALAGTGGMPGAFAWSSSPDGLVPIPPRTAAEILFGNEDDGDHNGDMFNGHGASWTTTAHPGSASSDRTIGAGGSSGSSGTAGGGMGLRWVADMVGWVGEEGSPHDERTDRSQ